MLASLHIRNYVLIDSLDIDFPKGLVIITGPTGAGKSILTGALGLLMGAKADASLIAAGRDNLVVEAEFEFEDNNLAEFCRAYDLDYDGGHLLIRRTVASSGRSRAFVNDEPVTVSVLEQLGRMLLDIHSQHDTLLLTDKRFQLSILDAYAGNSELLAQCADLYAQMRELSLQIEKLQTRIDRARDEADYNASRYEMLAKANLQESEIAALEQEQNQLAHSEQIKELLESSDVLFSGDGQSSDGVIAQLNSLLRNISRLSEFMPDVEALSERLDSARIEIKDIAEEISRTNDALSCSPERLEWVENRLSELYGLLKRFGCADETELIQRRDELNAMVVGVDDLVEEVSTLSRQLEQVKKEFTKVCDDLHEKRAAKALEFASSVKKNLAFMELDRAEFCIELTPVTPGPIGSDEITFLFSATGGRPAPVAKCASGGELSRIMLSLKQLMSGFMNMPTMIFDEIDTGVSGSVADKMGSVICSMGSSMQVFAITHLPQVAAKGNAHYLVQKTGTGETTVSTIKKLSDEQRVLEIARMLSASNLTPEAIANAKSLLDK